MTVSELADRYFDDHCKLHNRCTRRKKTSLNVIKNSLGRKPIETVDPREVVAIQSYGDQLNWFDRSYITGFVDSLNTFRISCSLWSDSLGFGIVPSET